MITLEHASRWYGQVIGVNDVSAHISSGITALLGPNGAGKSTLLKLVTGQLKPTTGRVTVMDARPFANPSVFRRLGYTPEMENLHDDMTGREFVTFLATLSGLPSATRTSRVDEAVAQVGLSDAADRKIGGYSKGMRQRIKIAQAIVHEPDVLILDEPLNGLDPVGRREMSRLFTDLAAQGKTVVVSSHILYEVEQLTHNILLMHRGRLLAQGDVYQIRSLIDAHPHRISITTPHARPLAKCLIETPFILSARLDAGRNNLLEIETNAPDAFYDLFPRVIMENNFTVESFESPDNNLEAVFRYLVTDGGRAKGADRRPEGRHDTK